MNDKVIFKVAAKKTILVIRFGVYEEFCTEKRKSYNKIT